jgi:2-succinyl-6-hydroxy-2,4-cyclohexadiene-1-carboxylate synthase
MAPAIVLLHGFTHTGASWEPVAAALAERYRALAPDLRGHGSASDAVPVTLEAVLGDLEALIPAGATLVGYSMGGRIALHAALRHPDRLARLVLIGASPGLADPGEREERRNADERLADELEAMSIEVLAERWARTPVLAGQRPEVLAAVHADRLRNTPGGLARALRGLGTGALPPLWDRLGELAVPTTLIAGERDEKFTALAEAMAASIADARVHVVAGAGHAAHLEAPAAVVQNLT